MIRVISILLFLGCSVNAESAPDASGLARDGDYRQAAAAYLMLAERAEAPVEILKARLNAASCMKMSGDISAAVNLLSSSLPLVGGITDNHAKALFFSEYGSVLSLGRRPSQSLVHLETAALLAEAVGDKDLLCEILNDRSIALSSSGDFREAFATSEKALSLVRTINEDDLLSRIRLNRLIISHLMWNSARKDLEYTLETQPGRASDAVFIECGARFDDCFSSSEAATRAAGNSPTLLYEAITAGKAAVRQGGEEKGFDLLSLALEKSRESGNLLLERAALLVLAELYLDHKRETDARLILDQIRHMSVGESPMQDAKAEILLSRCEMLPGGKPESARAHIERAIRLIESLRGDLAVSQNISDLGRTFRDFAGLPYLMLADLETRSPDKDSLVRARNAIETFKAWELDDYYRDDCVNLALQRQTDLNESLPRGVAVLYIIPLGDRTEILVGTSVDIARRTSKATAGELFKQTRLFRHRLEFESGLPSHIETSGRLYDQLIAPIRAILDEKGIRHLVIVPEGSLATIPFAALRDPVEGRFLIEDFSVSVSPGLALQSGGGADTADKLTTLAGLSESREGFATLPGVGPELARIAAIKENSDILLNAAFTPENLSEDLIETQPSIIHIASHAEFSSDPEQTFLLTYDGRVTMDDLEKMIRPRKFTGRPVELLCLSACRTAAGDDRAALGLAGVALKSGARTVIASLWHVNDTASSNLMVAFHRNLAVPGATKAEALRKAQLDMLRSDPYVHPYLWAPFVVIGDWK